MSDRARFTPLELDILTRSTQVVQANAAMIRHTQAEVGGHVDRDTVLLALHDGRRS